LTRLHKKNFTDKLSGMPFTRVDPALIEFFLEGLQVCDLIQKVPTAVRITILVGTTNHYILATPDGDDVHFEHVLDFVGIYPNILDIGNGVPGFSPQELDSYYEMVANQGE
jgi:hypothetical protein